MAVALAAGCTLGPPQPAGPSATQVPLPDGGGFAPCASHAAVPMAVPFRAEAVDDAQGRDEGLHRLDERTFLWVWGSFEETLRQDRVTRVNEVTVDREPDGTMVTCTRVELVTPVEVDGERRSYDVAVRLTATEGMPPGPVRAVVNWVAGCGGACEPVRGNATADFAG